MILIHLLIGALAMTTMFLLMGYARKYEIALKWWHWLLTGLGVLYAVFVLEIIAGFLAEGAPQAALVMGLITGILAVIWSVLLKRFVFVKPTLEAPNA